MDSNVYEALRYIDPDDYDDWLKVGMALKHEGCSLQDWEEWSSSSSKYSPRVCAEKWSSFREQNAGAPVTAGTIVQMAKDRGMSVSLSDGFDWDDPVKYSKKRVVRPDQKYFRENVLEHYSNRCVLCGKPATEAHHIIPVSVGNMIKYPEYEIWSISNGVALCKECHNKWHEANYKAEQKLHFAKQKRGE